MDLASVYEDVEEGIHRDSALRHKSLLDTLHAKKIVIDFDEVDQCEEVL